MRIVTLIAVLIILFLGITFAVLNAEVVTINYSFGVGHLPLSLLLIMTLIIGVFLGLACGMTMVFRAKLKQHKLNKQLQSYLAAQSPHEK